METLLDLFEDAVARFADRPALAMAADDGSRTVWTFRELHRRSRLAAWRLRAAGSPVNTGFGAIFFSWMLRYVAAVLLLGAGLGYLKLMPLPLLSAFAVTQFGFLMAARAPKI